MLSRCNAVQMQHCAGAMLFRCNTVQILCCSDANTVQALCCSGATLFGCNTVQMQYCAGTVLFRCNTLQVQRYSDATLFRCNSLCRARPAAARRCPVTLMLGARHARKTLQLGCMELLMQSHVPPVSHSPFPGARTDLIRTGAGKWLHFHPAALGYRSERGANYQQLVRASNYY